MISITKSQTPLYLRNSQIYKNLSEDEEDEFTIPLENFKDNDIVNNLDDFKLLLKTVIFFISDYPTSLVEYYKNNIFEIIEEYLIVDNVYDYNIIKNNLELKDFFLILYKLDIYSLDQFVGDYIIRNVYDIKDSLIADKFIQYGILNKEIFLNTYKIYSTIDFDDFIIEDIKFSLNDYIKYLYKELTSTVDITFILNLYIQGLLDVVFNSYIKISNNIIYKKKLIIKNLSFYEFKKYFEMIIDKFSNIFFNTCNNEYDYIPNTYNNLFIIFEKELNLFQIHFENNFFQITLFNKYKIYNSFVKILEVLKKITVNT